MRDVTLADIEQAGHRQRAFVIVVRCRVLRARLERAHRRSRWLMARNRLLRKEWRAIWEGRQHGPLVRLSGVTVLRPRHSR